jgi:hypothetical protein
MVDKLQLKERPQLSIYALVSFIVSFIVARTFTSLYPSVVFISSDVHVHHFWYGLALLAIGGWLGISYENASVDRLAAVLFGAGGGLIGDEVGLLLTFEDYWTNITYTFLITVLTLASILILLFRYSKIVRTEVAEFLGSTASFYVGIFLSVVSIAFISETDDISVITISAVFTTLGMIILLAYFVQRYRRKRSRQIKS